MVDKLRLVQPNKEPGNWMTHGRTYSEQRYSPLDQISDQNVGDLGLAWYTELSTDRGIEATPIVVDGVMFVTGGWSIVYAIDARNGGIIWTFDPQVPGAWAAKACCDVVNRGVAVWQGKVFVGTLDGRLIALDARTGERIWEVQTTDRDLPYTITGAPRVIDGKVIIGNGGADYGVRGYVTAYESTSGRQAWRFYTVPGDPEKPFESDAMEKAADTWTGEWWKSGGGGTVWNAMAYDEQLKLLYIGVGNGTPWSQRQ
jgi:quinohemoprotein ethanol dehydrogenase